MRRRGGHVHFFKIDNLLIHNSPGDTPKTTVTPELKITLIAGMLLLGKKAVYRPRAAESEIPTQLRLSSSL